MVILSVFCLNRLQFRNYSFTKRLSISVEVSESEIAQGVDQQINYWISLPQIGSKEKLEQFQNKSMTQIRQDLHDDYKKPSACTENAREARK